MCLSEPQAGSSLADIITRAEPTDDGHYRIVGSKMWISGGDHDLAENIIHMVLPKFPEARQASRVFRCLPYLKNGWRTTVLSVMTTMCDWPVSITNGVSRHRKCAAEFR